MAHRVKPSAFHTESPVFTLSSELGLKSSHLSSNPRWNTVRCSVIRGAQRKRVTGRAEGLMSDWCSHMLFTPVRNTRAERSHHKWIHVALSPWSLYWLGVQYIKTLAILLQDGLLHIVVLRAWLFAKVTILGKQSVSLVSDHKFDLCLCVLTLQLFVNKGLNLWETELAVYCLLKN